LAASQTLLFDHIHLAAPDAEVAANWFLDNTGGEYVDGRRDSVVIGATRVQFTRFRMRIFAAAEVPAHTETAILHLGWHGPDLQDAARHSRRS